MAAPDLRAAVRAGAAHLDTIAVEGSPDTSRSIASRSAATRTSSTSSRSSAGTPSTSGSTRRCPAWVSSRATGPAAVRAVGRRADPRRARKAGHRRPGPAAPRRADEPSRHRRARVDRGAPPATPRLAARRLPRPGVPRRDRDPGLGAARSPPDRVRGDFSPPTTVSGRSATPGAAKDAESHTESIARERELVQRYRSHRQFSKMHEHEARLERLLGERVEAPKSSRKLRLPGGALTGGGPARSGEIVVRIEDLVVGYLPGRGATDADGRPSAVPRPVARIPFLAAQRGDRMRDRRPEWGRKDDAPADDRRGAAADRRPADVRQRGPAGLPRAAPRRGDRRRHGPRRPARRDPADAGRRRVRTSPGSCSAATTRSRRSDRSRAGSGPARARAARDHALERAARAARVGTAGARS